MRNRIFAVLAIAVLAGGGLALATYNAIQQRQRVVVQQTRSTQPVVIANNDLALGAEMKARRPEGCNVSPRPARRKGRLSKPDEIVGRGVIVNIVKNEPILPAKLASKEAGAGLPPVIPEGMRAVSVRVNEVIGVAGYVLPGTRVDVLATRQPDQQPRGHDLEGRPRERAGADRRHADGSGPEGRQAGAGHGRDDVGHAGAGRAPGAREHRGQDSARAAQSAGSDGARDARHEARRAARNGEGHRAGADHRVGEAQARPGGHGPDDRRPTFPTVEIIRGDKRETEVVK